MIIFAAKIITLDEVPFGGKPRKTRAISHSYQNIIDPCFYILNFPFLSVFAFGQAKFQSSVGSVKEHVPEKKYSPPTEKLLLHSVPATTATQQECEEVQKKTSQPNPVQPKKSRRVLFEPLASDKEQETEGKQAI